MRVVLQRVLGASVSVDGTAISSIKKGMLILVGFENDDLQEDLEWMVKKIAQIRIFNDEQGVMNLSIQEVQGELLVVSQFTLHAKTKKGNRPSYIQAAKADLAIPLYEKFKQFLGIELEQTIQSGIFGADMKVQLINDGPVTIIIDSKNKDL
jgi:D-tyrosyl-tRNA(Tyr) deacylase